MNPRPDRQQSRSQAGETRRSWLRRRRRLPHRPGLEALEPRVVLSPTIYTVNSTGNGTGGSGTSGTLPYVISQANADSNPDGSEISFDPTVFSTPQTIDLDATLVLSETSGPEVIDGSQAVTISGQDAGTVFQVQSGVTATISGPTITGGLGSIFPNGDRKGGGLTIYGTANLIGCTISGNSSPSDGGGILNDGTAMLDRCTISGNSSYFGGALEDAGTLILTACTVSGNSDIPEFFGGIFLDGPALGMDPGASATLTDTIVAGNDSEDDIGFDGGTSTITGTYNLIGSEAFGWFVNGVAGNIVLTSASGPDLAPLGDYGGPTPTMALLPGSPAIGAGTAVAGITTDQRGEPLDSPPDIGAFQSHGFTISTAAGTMPQQTTDGIPFANPLAVIVTANDPSEPVAGGVVTFTESSPGSQADLSSGTATIGADGSASVIACNDSIAGSYTVSAGFPGVAPVSFSLTNLASTPIFDYTVNSTSGGISGSGTSGTLPYVQFLADADAAPHTEETVIAFDPTVFSAAETITLAATLTLSETSGPEAIDGPGAGLLTVSGGYAFSVFREESGVTATLSGLTIAGAGGGDIAPSGLIIYGTATATLDDCTISGYYGTTSVEGINIQDGTATATLDGCTIVGNHGAGDPEWRHGDAHRLHDRQQHREKRLRAGKRRHGDPHRLHDRRQRLRDLQRWRGLAGDPHRYHRRGQSLRRWRQRHRRRELLRRHRHVQPDRQRRLRRDRRRHRRQYRPDQPRRPGPRPAGGQRRADPDHGPAARQPRDRRRHARRGRHHRPARVAPRLAARHRRLPDPGDALDVASIAAVTPGVRNTPVSSVDVTLNRARRPGRFRHRRPDPDRRRRPQPDHGRRHRHARSPARLTRSVASPASPPPRATTP